MKNTFALMALTCIVLLSGFESRAATGTIATAQYSSSGGTVGIIGRTLNIAIGYFPSTNTSSIFTQFTFHTNDVGHVFSINSLSPGFNAFVFQATNGIPDTLGESFTLGAGAANGSQGLPETSFYTGVAPGGNGIDLQGFQIQGIDLRLDSLVFNSPGSDPNGNGNWTDFSFHVTLSFLATVPEPSAAAILGCGLLVIFCRKRMKRVRNI